MLLSDFHCTLHKKSEINDRINKVRKEKYPKETLRARILVFLKTGDQSIWATVKLEELQWPKASDLLIKQMNKKTLICYNNYN